MFVFPEMPHFSHFQNEIGSPGSDGQKKLTRTPQGKQSEHSLYGVWGTPMVRYKTVPVKYSIKISISIFQALKSEKFKRSFENQSKIIYTHRIQKLNEILAFQIKFLNSKYVIDTVNLLTLNETFELWCETVFVTPSQCDTGF